jgi:hypothetical protein
MKKLSQFLLILLFLPLGSFTQVMVNANNNTYYSQAGSSAGFSNYGGKKKKSSAKKETKTEKKAQMKKSEPKNFNLNFYAGADLAFGFPLGSLRDSINNGTGFNIRAEYFLTPNINVGLWTGFKSFTYDPVLFGEGHWTYIPVKATGTYYFDDGKFRPYANLGLGLYMIREKYDADFFTVLGTDTIFESRHVDEKQSKFGFSPNVGVLYNIQDTYFVNVSFGYEMILTEDKSSSLMGINIGLIYKFGF